MRHLVIAALVAVFLAACSQAGAADSMVFQENFNTNVTLGQWASSPYAAKFDNYDGWTDTSGHGTYNTAKTLSVSGGNLNINLYSEQTGGVWKHWVAALLPKWPCADNLSQKCHSLDYGYVGVRFRADAAAHYKTAWLLWPDSNVWPQGGEIDFPESCSDLTGPICFATHSAQSDPNAVHIGTTSTTYANWHMAEMTWTPTQVNYWIDGSLIGVSYGEAAYPVPGGPSNLMHYVLQTETETGGQPAPSNSAQARAQLDGIEIWDLDGVNDNVRPGT